MDNSIKLIETSLTEIGVEASTHKELRMITGSLRSGITKSIAKQVDIDKENRNNKKTISYSTRLQKTGHSIPG